MMKTVILAGGFGTRLNNSLEKMPKPMAMIGNKPIIWHIMKHFSNYELNDFHIALGYKKEAIVDYFLNYKRFSSDLKINLKSNKITYFENDIPDWNISLFDTGNNSMTGGRVLRIKSHLKDTFILTYGDGLANINVNELINFHKSHGKLITVTAVRPAARFGELNIDGDRVTSFYEKPQIGDGWVNGGFFVVDPKFLDYINDDTTVLEKFPLEKAAQDGELMAYKFDGFWQCVDTKRDLDYLNELYSSDSCPWRI